MQVGNLHVSQVETHIAFRETVFYKRKEGLLLQVPRIRYSMMGKSYFTHGFNFSKDRPIVIKLQDRKLHFQPENSSFNDSLHSTSHSTAAFRGKWTFSASQSQTHQSKAQNQIATQSAPESSSFQPMPDLCPDSSCVRYWTAEEHLVYQLEWLRAGNVVYW